MVGEVPSKIKTVMTNLRFYAANMMLSWLKCFLEVVDELVEVIGQSPYSMSNYIY